MLLRRACLKPKAKLRVEAVTPILLIGAGALGVSILKGIAIAGHMDLSAIMVCDLNPSDALKAFGVALNPSPERLMAAKTVILAVKPQAWQTVAETYSPLIDSAACLVSVMAGVKTEDLARAFEGCEIARVMPTTGVATAKGVASIFAPQHKARAAAHYIFDAIATTVDLDAEDLIDAATAVSGSGPAYVYAFVRALEAAAKETGLSAQDAKILARATLIAAAHLLDVEGSEPDDLIKKVMSPGGTTEAGIKVLCAENGIDALLSRTVNAALLRAKALG
jgi:pyrroline-5-carboxylate reductase